VTASGNSVGTFANGSTLSVTIADTVASNNNYGIGATTSAVMVSNTTVSSNIGIASDQTAVTRVVQSTLTANGSGWQATNCAQIVIFRNNSVAMATNGAPTSAIALQ
jgi:hypothetical protein